MARHSRWRSWNSWLGWSDDMCMWLYRNFCSLYPSTPWLFPQTEAGCRVPINLILLHVASTMSTNQMDVNIIPEFPITKTVFPGNHSFGGVVDFLLTKLPERYTGEHQNCCLGHWVSTSLLQNFYLLIQRALSLIWMKWRELPHQIYLRQSVTMCEQLCPKPLLPPCHIANSISMTFLFFLMFSL